MPFNVVLTPPPPSQKNNTKQLPPSPPVLRFLPLSPSPQTFKLPPVPKLFTPLLTGNKQDVKLDVHRPLIQDNCQQQQQQTTK